MFRIILSAGILLICLLCWSTMNADAKVRGYWAFNTKKDVGKDSGPFEQQWRVKGTRHCRMECKG